MLKRIFVISASILMLAIAFHLGVRSVQAQAGSPITGLAVVQQGGNPTLWVITPSGDVYSRTINFTEPGGPCRFPLQFTCNFWNGAVQVKDGNWGDVKQEFRK